MNIIGSGGHARTIAHMIREGDRRAVFFEKNGHMPPKGEPVIIGVGGPDRIAIYKALRKEGYDIIGFGYTGRAAHGRGLQVLKLVYVGPNCDIGHNVILNTGCIVEHDCTIGNHVHIAPGAVVLGGCTIEDEAMVGANATVLPGATVPAGYLVKAGTVYGGES